MNKKNEIVLDFIPTKEKIWHFRAEKPAGIKKEVVIELILEEIKHKFSDCNAVIILEKGKVIEVL